MSAKLGQHFLINKELIKKIVEKSELTRRDVVLEIGAGTGNLTRELAKTGAKIIALEIDKNLIPVLKERIKNKNVEIIQADILKYKIPRSITRIVSNLPYEISAPLTEKLIDEWNKKYWCVLMYQEEFVEKMLAEPGTPWFSRISFLVNYFCDYEDLFLVSRENFKPIPKVDSRIIKLAPKKPLDKKLILFVNYLFNHKNKTARNSLISSRKKFGLEKKEINNLFKKMSVDFQSKKVWQLEFNEIRILYKVFKKYLNERA